MNQVSGLCQILLEHLALNIKHKLNLPYHFNIGVGDNKVLNATIYILLEFNKLVRSIKMRKFYNICHLYTIHPLQCLVRLIGMMCCTHPLLVGPNCQS